LAGLAAAFTDAGPPFADLCVPGFAVTTTLALGSRGGGPEAEMVSERQVNRKQSGNWTGAFWFTGVAMFMVEWNAGLDYVQARLAALAPNFLGCLPGAGLAAWRMAEGAFWNCGQLEAVFRTMPLVTLPFVLVLLGLAMKEKTEIPRQGMNQSEDRSLVD